MRRPTRDCGRDRDRESGMSTLEVVLLAPLVIGFVMFLVCFGVLVNARGTVQGAARDAARMGSLQRDDETANSSAYAAAAADLGNTCSVPFEVQQVDPDTKAESNDVRRRRAVHDQGDVHGPADRTGLVQHRQPDDRQLLQRSARHLPADALMRADRSLMRQASRSASAQSRSTTACPPTPRPARFVHLRGHLLGAHGDDPRRARRRRRPGDHRAAARRRHRRAGRASRRGRSGSGRVARGQLRA